MPIASSIKTYRNYDQIFPGNEDIAIIDHLGGFSENLTNPILDRLRGHSGKIYLQFIANDQIRKNYPDLDLKFCGHYESIDLLKPAPTDNKKSFENFLCSFNGADGVGRQFLTAAMYKKNWFNSEFSSKNFSYSHSRLDGNIASYCTSSEERFYRKFIIDDSESAKNFYLTTYGFEYTANEHNKNLQILINKINRCCLQLVAETVCVSYHPWISEKFLYPVVAKHLWIAYAQPGYYEYLEQYYKFKKFQNIFDYEFDSIKNPVIRLIKLFEMIGKFDSLSYLDWHDLYLLEEDTIEYNYDHYFSGDYLKKLNHYYE